ncbi:hypothetical protein DIE15_32080 [Burkholderia sp. Bp9031]|uniref:hypothetical protein n=1 Tax=Burkholderia sp. Bp9031 TaxID=2184566 RepID=UPI000F5F0B2F|nr:hypothetical protein [Burkholderia sp. Bp9031]RQZ09286.1 hypothetical protein DIE15_32080 [Burkholderia sp. Bp9031]
MTGVGKGAAVPRRDGAGTPNDSAANGRRAPARPGSNGARRDDANRAWVKGAPHYDWMDHAPPFDIRD